MKRNGFALASAIIGTAGFVFATIYYYTSVAAVSGSFFRIALDGYVIQALAAVALNWAAWAHSAKVPMLIASIIYCPAILCMFFSGVFFVLCVVFGFIAYAQLKRRNANEAPNNKKTSVR